MVMRIAECRYLELRAHRRILDIVIPSLPRVDLQVIGIQQRVAALSCRRFSRQRLTGCGLPRGLSRQVPHASRRHQASS